VSDASFLHNLVVFARVRAIDIVERALVAPAILLRHEIVLAPACGRYAEEKGPHFVQGLTKFDGMTVFSAHGVADR
jgi:4-hydroxy-3-methylbut-2-enyl diphosphate reductase IspH